MVIKHGFTCDMAEDGVIALKMISQSKANPYDVIFMDNNMPNMVSYSKDN